MKFQEDWPNSFKGMKGQNQHFEKAIRPVFKDLVTDYTLEYEVGYITV